MKNRSGKFLLVIISVCLLVLTMGSSLTVLAAEAQADVVNENIRKAMEAEISFIEYTSDMQRNPIQVTDNKFDSIIQVNGTYVGIINVKYSESSGVTYNKAVLTSNDRMNWFFHSDLTEKQNMPPESYDTYSIKFVNGFYIVKNFMAYTYFSQDAVKWEEFTDSQKFADITYNKGMFWAVDRSCTVYSSVDMKDWEVSCQLDPGSYLYSTFESGYWGPGHFATDLVVINDKAIISFYNPNETGVTNYGGIAVYDLVKKRLLKPTDINGSFDGFEKMISNRTPSFISSTGSEVVAGFKKSYDDPVDLNLKSRDGIKWSKISDAEAKTYLQKVGASSKQGIGVTVNGKPVIFDFPPVIDKGRTIVPLRMIFESLGMDVSYDAATKTVTGVSGSKVIKISVDTTTAEVNGGVVTLDVPAKTLNGRIYVPARFIAESLGMKVNWNAASKIVSITN